MKHRQPMYILGANSDRDARTATTLLKLMGYPPGTFADCAHVFQLFGFAKGSQVSLGYIGNVARQANVGPVMPPGFGSDRVGSRFVPAPLMTLNHFYMLPSRLYKNFEVMGSLDPWDRLSTTSRTTTLMPGEKAVKGPVTLPLTPSPHLQDRTYAALRTRYVEAA